MSHMRVLSVRGYKERNFLLLHEIEVIKSSRKNQDYALSLNASCYIDSYTRI